MIVGSFDDGAVTEYNPAGGVVATPVPGGQGYNPAAIVRDSSGNLYIADLAFESNATDHHQILKYNATTHVTGQLVNLTTPTSTGDPSGLPPQPASLLIDTDGNLLVGMAPDDFDDGAIEKFNITNNPGQFMGTVASGIGEPSGLAFISAAPTAVSGVNLFYDNSRFNKNVEGVAGGTTDNKAIDTTKSAYLPGTGTASFANISAFIDGINGIMVDLTTPDGAQQLSASDFTFRVGTNNSPSTWATAPAPSTVFGPRRRRHQRLGSRRDHLDRRIDHTRMAGSHGQRDRQYGAIRALHLLLRKRARQLRHRRYQLPGDH